MSEATWLALESNPEAINSFMTKMGISSVSCVDIYSFDEEMLGFIPAPQLAVILCFPSAKAKPYLTDIYEKMSKAGQRPPADVFFMKQKIRNACGTFALFNALANLEGAVDLGNGSFHQWLQKAKAADEETRSALLEKDNSLASAHAEAARAGETVEPEKVDLHFICYVSKGDILYEIDSRAPFPRPLGPTTSTSLVKDAGAVIMDHVRRIDENSFSAMALVSQ